MLEEDVKFQNGLHVVYGAFENEIEGLQYFLADKIVLVGCLVVQEQTDYFVQIFGDKIHKIQLIHCLNTKFYK